MDWIDASPDVVADLEQAMDYVWDKLDERNQQMFRETPREDLVQYHHGLGRAIRNDLFYGRDIEKDGKSAVHCYFDSLGVPEVDDMSGIIIEALWCKVNGVEFDLMAKVKYYQDYYKQRDGGG